MRDVNFAIVDVAYEGSNAMNPNLEGLIFADDQAGFLAGVIAGGVASELSKKVGVIGGWPIPPVKRFINGFAGGVEYACSGCSTTIIYCPFGGAEPTTGLTCSGAFADVAFGVGVAKYLMNANVDVIFGAGGLTGSAGIKYASAPQGTAFALSAATAFDGSKTESATPYVVGVDNDEYYTTFESGAWPGASKLITSALKKVDKGVQLSIENYVNGVASGSNFRLDASNGGVGFAPAHDASDVVTAAITAMAQSVFDSMAAGTFSTYIQPDGEVVPPAEHWVYDNFGTIVTHPCGTGACPLESALLSEEERSDACSGAYASKVTVVLDNAYMEDGTFNQLAYEGAQMACTAEASCCLEVDKMDDDVEDPETEFFCEVEYAAADSDLVIGVGFLHEQSVHRVRGSGSSNRRLAGRRLRRY